MLNIALPRAPVCSPSVDDGPGHSRGGNDTILHECRALLAIPVAGPRVSLAFVAVVALWLSASLSLFSVLRHWCLRGTPRHHKGNDVPDSGRPYAGDVLGRETTPGLTPAVGRQPVQRAPPQLWVDPLAGELAQVQRITRPWHFIILGPDLSKEHVQVSLSVPCDLADAFAGVCAARQEDRQLFYDILLPVVPFVCRVGLLMPLLSALTPGRLMAGCSVGSFRPS